MSQIPSVLIVDDSPGDCYLTAYALNKSGRVGRVWSLHEPRQVLDHYADYAAACAARPGEFPPALIILDINMPGMSGFELADALQARTFTKSGVAPPVICMLTASVNETDSDRAKRHPLVHAYYTKPLSSENVAELLTKFGAEDS